MMAYSDDDVRVVCEALAADQVGAQANPGFWDGEARNVLDALTQHGRLTILTEPAVLAAAKAIEKLPHAVWNSPTRQDALTLARTALNAAALAAEESPSRE